MDIIDKRDNSPKTIQSVEREQEISEPGSILFNINSNLNRRILVLRRPNRRSREEVASKYLQLVFRNNGKNWWGVRHFECYGQRASSLTEEERQKLRNIWDTEENEPALSTANCPIVDLEHYDIGISTLLYIQTNHIVQKRKIKNIETEKILQKTKFNFMVDLKSILHKIPANPTVLQL